MCVVAGRRSGSRSTRCSRLGPSRRATAWCRTSRSSTAPPCSSSTASTPTRAGWTPSSLQVLCVIPAGWTPSSLQVQDSFARWQHPDKEKFVVPYHCTQVASKELRKNVRARVWSGLDLNDTVCYWRVSKGRGSQVLGSPNKEARANSSFYKV